MAALIGEPTRMREELAPPSWTFPRGARTLLES